MNQWIEEIERLKAENTCLKKQIARHEEDAESRSGEIERLKESIEGLTELLRQEEGKDKEIDFYQREFEKCRLAKDNILTELRDKDKEIDRLKSLLSLTPEDIKTSTPATAIHLNHENNALRKQIARLKAEIEAFEAMKEGVTERINDMSAEIAELRTELAEAKNKQVLDQKQCDDMTAEAARMAAEIKEGKRQAAKG